MTKVAEHSELSKGTLYLYFRNKESIVYELLLDFLNELKRRVEEAAKQEGSGYEKSKCILETFSSYHRENEEYLNLSRYLDYQVSSVTDAGEEASRCFSVIDELKQISVGVIRGGQKDGSIRSDLDPALTAATVVHVVESFLLKLSTRKQIVAERSKYEPKELVEHLLGLILSSLQKPTEREIL